MRDGETDRRRETGRGMANGHERALQRTREGKGGVVYKDPSTGFVFVSDNIATKGGGHGVIGLGVRFGAYERQPKEQRELLRKRGERWVHVTIEGQDFPTSLQR